jgi:hypothetical protein
VLAIVDAWMDQAGAIFQSVERATMVIQPSPALLTGRVELEVKPGGRAAQWVSSLSSGRLGLQDFPASTAWGLATSRRAAVEDGDRWAEHVADLLGERLSASERDRVGCVARRWSTLLAGHVLFGAADAEEGPMLFVRAPDRTVQELARAVDELLGLIDVPAFVAPLRAFAGTPRRTSRKETIAGLEVGHETLTFRTVDRSAGERRVHLRWARSRGHAWLALSEHDTGRAFSELVTSPEPSSDAAIRETERRRPKGALGLVLRGPRGPSPRRTGAVAFAIGPVARGLNADFAVDFGSIERFVAGVP